MSHSEPINPTEPSKPTELSHPGEPSGAYQVVHRYWEHVWIQGDLSVLGDLYTDPTVRHTNQGTITLSIREFETSLADSLRAIRGESFHIDQLTVVEDVAWLRLTLRALSMATMAPMTFSWLAQYRLVDSKIAETWALHQSGLDWT